MFINELFNEFA
jgi:hypothetical protein